MRSGDQPRWLTLGDIDKRKCIWRSDCVDRVKTVAGQVEQKLWKTVAGRSRIEVIRVELRATRMEYATREQFGGLSLKITRWTVSRVCSQNPDRGSKEKWGRHVEKSQRLHQGEVNLRRKCGRSIDRKRI
jgi:hypothetical protein